MEEPGKRFLDIPCCRRCPSAAVRVSVIKNGKDEEPGGVLETSVGRKAADFAC